mgnify:CR=1 FL=1
MRFTRLQLKNWKNFRKVDVELQERVFIVGPNAGGKSNLLDARAEGLCARWTAFVAACRD